MTAVVERAPQLAGPLLEVRDLVAGYGAIEVLHGASLAVEPGSITVLLGSNGAGKTSLMRTLAGLMAPRRGSIQFAGAGLDRLGAHERVARGIALVPEGRMIFPHLTVEETLRVGAYGAWARPYFAESLERAYALFPRLAERKRQSAGALSGGEQQMLAIARALMARPRLLLLDEPTLGLAPKMARFVFDLTRELQAAGLTLLLAEQDVRMSLRIADHGYVLENGRIVMAGPAQELSADPRIRTSYLGL
jgi:branched-chain amino acid transport system ATP-binding protein